MVRSTHAATLLVALASASPVQDLVPRFNQEIYDMCTVDVTSDVKGGLLFASSGEESIECDVIDQAKTENGVKCYMTADGDPYATPVKCPADPPPKRNPDGSESSIVEDIITTWCKVASGGPPALDFVNLLGCFQFGIYEAGGDPVKENESGALAVCNTMFVGACNFFINVAPDLVQYMQRPCSEDPDSQECQFAGPGRKV